MYMLDLEKAEKPEIKLPTSVIRRKSKRIPEKHLLIDMIRLINNSVVGKLSGRRGLNSLDYMEDQ